ncbi:MAG: hypothetical protein PVJ53_00645 [Desulfobacterales bacterium]
MTIFSLKIGGYMSAAAKLIVAGLLFLGSGLCIYGYLAEKLVNISVFTSLVVSAACTGIFIFFAFFDPNR